MLAVVNDSPRQNSKEGVTMSDKERKKKKLVRTLICVSAAVVVVLVIATLVIGQLPLPAQ